MRCLVILIAVLVGTVMSASIMHKEIELGHNGVHYKVSVDAEPDQNNLDEEHQPEVGKIGIHYDIPHTGQLQDDEDEKHHGVVVHIELGGDQEPHHHEHEDEDEEHHGWSHQDQQAHHGAKRQILTDNYLGQHEFPSLVQPSYGLNQHLQNVELQQYILHHPELGYYVHHGLGGQGLGLNDLSVYGLGHQQNSLVDQNVWQQGHVPQELIHHGISQYNPQVYDPELQHLGQGVHFVQHHVKPHVLGHGKKNFWLHQQTVGPNSVYGGVQHSVPIELDDSNEIEQGVIGGQPGIGLGVMHSKYHTDYHH